MKSEFERAFYEDLQDKKSTSRSAFKKKTHCGKAGCKLPSDSLSKKELRNMNGACEVYRLNSPMKWDEFVAMPLEHQATYIRKLRNRFNVSNKEIARMLCISYSMLDKQIRKLGCSSETVRNRFTKWDSDGWFLFVNGVEMSKIEASSDEVVLNPAKSFEFTVDEDNRLETQNEALSDEDVAFISEQTDPFEAPAVEEVPFEEDRPVPVFEDSTCEKVCAIPDTGSMTFTGNATQIVNTLLTLLGNTRVLLSVKWDVVED